MRGVLRCLRSSASGWRASSLLRAAWTGRLVGLDFAQCLGDVLRGRGKVAAVALVVAMRPRPHLETLVVAVLLHLAVTVAWIGHFTRSC